MQKRLKWSGALVAALVLCEFGARVVVDRWYPDGALVAATGCAATALESLEPLEDQEGPRFLLKEGIHPYLGFLPRAAPHPTSDSANALNRAELYLPGSALFSHDPVDLVVGVFGGSMAEQFCRLGGAEPLGRLLESQPRFAGRDVRLLNLATGGFKQPQQLFALDFLLVQGGRLDLVINLDGFNEVALHQSENERSKIAPVYPRNWLLRVERLNTAVLLGECAYLERLRSERAAGLLSSPLRGSRIRQLVWAVGDRALLRERAPIEERIRGYESRQELDFVTQGPRDPQATYGERQATLVDVWRRSSRQMSLQCLANGIEYYHFLQPNQYVAGSKPMADEEARVAIRGNHPYGKHVPGSYPLLQAGGAWLEGEGVRFHDLTSVFEGHPEALYKDDCCHVNARGNEILAAAMAEAIESWGQ